MHAAPTRNALIRKLTCTSVAAILFLATLTPSLQADSNSALPELGDPSSQTISPAKEREIGKQFYRRAREHPSFVSDLQINHYIQALGNRLINRNDLGNDSFTFFVLDNDAINAFAVPGGYIGFYHGLIDVAENESQLASVVAHEIAHVTQRHLARFYAKQEGISLATTAAILAGIIASAQGAGQAGAASIYAGVAANQQAQINFTRGHEEEADRIGIALLANGGYDTHSMANMFDVLQRASLQSDNERYEFLRTHPLSSQRVAEARARAGAHSNDNAITDRLDFALIKARLNVVTSDNLPQLQRTYEARDQEQPAPENHYALALIHQLLGAPERAEPYVNKLREQIPESIMVSLLYAENLLERGETTESLAVYAEMHNNFPLNYPVLAGYAQALGRNGEHRTATAALKDYLFEAGRPNVQAYRELAYHQKLLRQMANSRISMADYFLGIEDQDAAHSQLKLAMKEADISEETRQIADAKLTDLEESRKRDRR